MTKKNNLESNLLFIRHSIGCLYTVSLKWIKFTEIFTFYWENSFSSLQTPFGQSRLGCTDFDKIFPSETTPTPLFFISDFHNLKLKMLMWGMEVRLGCAIKCWKCDSIWWDDNDIIFIINNILEIQERLLMYNKWIFYI